MLSICNKITGTDSYLTWTDRWSWQDNVSGFLFGCPHPRSIEPLLKIHGYDVKPLVEQKYLRMASELRLREANFIGLIGPKFKEHLASYTQEMWKNFEKIKDHRYTQFYYDTNDWLWTLKPAPLDYTRLRAIEETGHGYKFRRTKTHIEPVRYVRSKIKTGRLSVIRGPQVMTMKAEHRNMLKDCRQIDFSSMEPRFLLNVSGQHVDGDLYDWVASKANLSGDRTHTKIAIISSLYGSARQIPAVTKLFALEEWEKQLEANVVDDVIENYFGRPVQTEGVRGRHLLSLWLQSSAADAALKGFATFFRDNRNLNPHWVIHDACIFSGEGNVPEEIIIEGMKFPITCEEVK